MPTGIEFDQRSRAIHFFNISKENTGDGVLLLEKLQTDSPE